VPVHAWLFERERLSSCESFLDAVPVRDRGLAEPPAQVHVLAAANRREVDETLVGILHLDSERVHGVDAPRDALELGGDAFVELRELTRIDAAAVSGDLRGELTTLVARGGERVSVLDEPFEHRAELGQQRVRLLGREEPLRHRAYDRDDVASGQRAITLADIDAVTIDGYGTLLELDGALERLHALVPECERTDVERAFGAEAAYYCAHSHEGRDEATLARLREDCARVFSDAVGVAVTANDFIAALQFAVLPGVVPALRSLRARGVALAVVANWDFGLHDELERHALRQYFDAVVTSAETGTKKPDPAPFHIALAALGVAPARVVHVGDHEDDERGAAAAGVAFARAPLGEAVAQWT